MDRFERIVRLHRLLAANRRYGVTLAQIMERLECSRATARRVIAHMRLYLGAPLIWDPKLRRYRYAEREGEGPWELPGLWLGADELHALLAAERLLEQVEPGLLEPELGPLRRRIRELLRRVPGGGEALAGRVRLAPIGRRQPSPEAFRTVADALARRRRLRILYHGRASDEETERTVSPQRLVHYRDNWYLDAWCHLRRGLRTFALDRIRRVRVLEEAAKAVPEARLERYYARSYGIFGGEPRHEAVLVFTAERARWVAEERWHPEQRGRTLDDGRYELRIPYGDPRELVMDILKYGPDVEVVAPAELRRQVAERLRSALAAYAGADERGRRR